MTKVVQLHANRHSYPELLLIAATQASLWFNYWKVANHHHFITETNDSQKPSPGRSTVFGGDRVEPPSMRQINDEQYDGMRQSFSIDRYKSHFRFTFNPDKSTEYYYRLNTTPRPFRRTQCTPLLAGNHHNIALWCWNHFTLKSWPLRCFSLLGPKIQQFLREHLVTSKDYIFRSEFPRRHISVWDSFIAIDIQTACGFLDFCFPLRNDGGRSDNYSCLAVDFLNRHEIKTEGKLTKKRLLHDVFDTYGIRRARI